MICLGTFSGNSAKKRDNEYSQKTGLINADKIVREPNAKKQNLLRQVSLNGFHLIRTKDFFFCFSTPF